MSAVECPHCFTLGFFTTTDLCACCGKSIDEKPELAKEEALLKKEYEDLVLQIEVRKKALPKQIIGAGFFIAFFGAYILFVVFVKMIITSLAAIPFFIGTFLLFKTVKDIAEIREISQKLEDRKYAQFL